MGEVVHRELASGKWDTFSLAFQMGNIGSEVSRALKWNDKGRQDRMTSSLDRALELLDLSIASATASQRRELCRAREELCDYFYAGNTFRTPKSALMAYYDQFAMAR